MQYEYLSHMMDWEYVSLGESRKSADIAYRNINNNAGTYATVMTPTKPLQFASN